MINRNRFCLLVEDDPEDQEFFMETLSSVSSRTACYAVSNGEEALVMLRKAGVRPDYIFTDIHMPRMDGYQFIQELRSSADYKNIPVVVYSSNCCQKHMEKMSQLDVLASYRKSGPDVLSQILHKYFV